VSVRYDNLRYMEATRGCDVCEGEWRRIRMERKEFQALLLRDGAEKLCRDRIAALFEEERRWVRYVRSYRQHVMNPERLARIAAEDEAQRAADAQHRAERRAAGLHPTYTYGPRARALAAAFFDGLPCNLPGRSPWVSYSAKIEAEKVMEQAQLLGVQEDLVKWTRRLTAEWVDLAPLYLRPNERKAPPDKPSFRWILNHIDLHALLRAQRARQAGGTEREGPHRRVASSDGRAARG
jgi:hypothetical protein